MKNLKKTLVIACALSLPAFARMEAQVLFSASFDGTINDVVAASAGSGNYVPEVGFFSNINNASNATIQADPGSGSENVLRMVRTGPPEPAVSPNFMLRTQDLTTPESDMLLNLEVNFRYAALGDAGGMIFHTSDLGTAIAGFNLNSFNGNIRVYNNGTLDTANTHATSTNTWYKLEFEITFGTISGNQIAGSYNVFLTPENGTRTEIFSNRVIPNVSATSDFKLYVGVNQKTVGDGIATIFYRDLNLVVIPEVSSVLLLCSSLGMIAAMRGFRRRIKVK